MNWRVWSRCDSRRTWRSTGYNLVGHGIQNDITVDGQVCDLVEWQSMLELGKVTPVDGDFEGMRLAEYENGEIVAGSDGRCTVVLLVAPGEVLDVIASDHVIGESGRYVNGNVVSWIQLRAELIVDGETDCVSGHFAVDLEHLTGEEATVNWGYVWNILKAEF